MRPLSNTRMVRDNRRSIAGPYPFPTHLIPHDFSPEVASKGPGHDVLATVLPLAFIYAIIGNIAIFPVCFELILHLILEILKISSNISKSLTARKQHEDEMTSSIQALAVANKQLGNLKLKQLVDEAERQKCEAQLAATNQREKNRLFDQVEALEQKIGELCLDLENVRAENVKITDAHRKELATLHAKVKTERDEAVVARKALQETITEQRNQAEKTKVENFQLLKETKAEVIRARNEMVS
jgi:hypothetical protein